MEKKFITDMNMEELGKVFDANEKLQNDVLEDMIETELYYITEQLDYFRNSLSDWSIGVGQRNYMYIDNYVSFINNLEEVEKAIPILHDEDMDLLAEAVEVVEDYRSTDMYTAEFDNIESKLENVALELADIIIQRFTDILDGCFNTEHQRDYFTEFYADSRLSEDCYIDAPDFVLKEDVTKIYN